MPLTSLAKNLLVASTLSAVLLHRTGIFLASVVTCVALQVVAVLLHRRPDGKLSVQDRCLINIDRLSKGQQPGSATITICMYFASSKLPSAEQAKAAMQRAIGRFPRFASIAVEAPSVDDAYWRPLGSLDVGRHISKHPPLANDADALKAQLNELANTELPRDRPLWQLHIVPTGGSHGCVVLRANHAIADGLRLVGAAREFLCFADGTPASLEVLSRMANNKRSVPPRGAFGLARDLIEAATLDSLKDESPSCLHAPGTLFPRSHSRSTVSSWVSMADIKAVRAAAPAGCTINDVVLTALCGAVTRYAAAVGKPLGAGTVMRALCVASMPTDPSRPDDDLYNDFIMPSLDLSRAVASEAISPDSKELSPVSLSRSQRLARVHASMERLKGSRAGFFMGKLLTVAARLGLDAMVGATQNTVFSKHTLVYSNMPGFEQRVHLFGPSHPVERFAVYNPNLISQCFFLSYNGELCFSLSTDAATVERPTLLVESFAAEVHAWAADVRPRA